MGDKAFVVSYKTKQLGRYRFEVFSGGAEECRHSCGPEVCSAIPTGTVWFCDNFSRPDFTIAAIRAAFPEVQCLEWEDAPWRSSGSTWILGSLQGTLELEEALERDTLELRARIAVNIRAVDALTAPRMVELDA